MTTSHTRGKHTVYASTCEQAIKLLDLLDRLDYEASCRQWLNERQHLHEFGYDRLCKCGMTPIKYALGRELGTDGSRREICPVALEQMGWPHPLAAPTPAS